MNTEEDVRTSCVKELQMVVRDAPLIPIEVEPFVGVSFRRASQIFEIFQGLKDSPVETFIVLHLNQRNVLVAMSTVSVGTLACSLAHPREIFRAAVSNLTAGVIFVHNHPSGDPTPSRDDLVVTERLCKAGEILGIKVLDHIVIAGDEFVSLKEGGFLQGPQGSGTASVASRPGNGGCK